MVIFKPLPATENFLLNSNFTIAQEWTSKAAIAHTDYVLDGWKYVKVGTMVHTASRSTDTPTVAQLGYSSPYSIKLDCTTVDSSIAAGDICEIETHIEGHNAINLFEQAIVLRFWHKHTKTGTYSVSIGNATDRSFVREYTQSTTDTWEEAVIYIDASPSAGTWLEDYQLGFRLTFCVASGSTYTTTAGSWATGNYVGSSNNVNACDSTSNNFMINSPCLYAGTKDRGYYSPSFEQQLKACQRLFEKSYDLDVDPGTETETGSLKRIAKTSYLLYDSEVPFTVRKRTTPTIGIYSAEQTTSPTGEGYVGRYSTGSSFIANVAAGDFNVAEKSFNINGINTFTADTDQIRFHYTADARF